MTSNSSGSTGVTIGLDLGDRYSELCVVDAAGTVQQRATIRTTAEGLTHGLAPYAGARVVLEVGMHSPWVSRHRTQRGHEVVVANPGHVRRIAALCRRVTASTPSSWRASGVPIRRSCDRSCIAAPRRSGIARCCAYAITSCACGRGSFCRRGGLAKALGTRLPRCGAKGFATRMHAAGLDAVFPGMATVCEVVAVLTQQVKTLNAMIARVTHAQRFIPRRRGCGK